MISCVIPARMSSSRFPGKPLYKILGKELILHVCDVAKNCSSVDQVIVATEDQEIHDLVTQYGFGAVITGKFPTCTHRVADAARKFLDKPDYIVNLQGDEPCIKPYMIDEMIEFTVQHQYKMVQGIYDINTQDLSDEDCVKAVVNNGTITYLTRNPEVITDNLKGIAGIYVYEYNTLIDFHTYDLRLVNAWEGLDTFGFIGKVPVIPYKLPYRTHAVDRLSDIRRVENEICR